MRGGEDLVPMTQDLLQRIFAETQPDFSAELCRGATLSDLDPIAVEKFRTKWAERSKRSDLLSLPVDLLLEDAELTRDGGVTYAALILLGSQRAMGRHLAQAEVVFEYRSDDASISYQQRQEFRQGFLLFEEDLWTAINLRNDLHALHDGLFRREIPTLNENAVREAILNAVSHRDYRLAGSVFVRQFHKWIQVESPGGFPVGVTADNILASLIDAGALERPSPKKLTLSRRYYAFVGKRGEYTRRRGLDRDTNKALLRKHVERNAREGSPLSELNQVLPSLSPSRVQNLLRELKQDGLVHPLGKTKAARWYPGPGPVEAGPP